MTTLTIRVRVRDGKLEPLDALPLPEGTEVTATINVPDESGEPADATEPKLSTWNLGAPSNLTRKDYYEEAPTSNPVGSYPLGAPVPLTRGDFYDDDK